MLGPEQVPNTELSARKVLALSRIMCPEANIPATTAVAVSEPKGIENALAAGANVIMMNATPHAYRQLYSIYPMPLAPDSEVGQHGRILELLSRVGRRPGQGPGGRRRTVS